MSDEKPMPDENARGSASPPAKPRVAPPPPPPPELDRTLRSSQGRGFDPKARHLVFEVGIALCLVLGLAVGVIFLGGSLAAWATPLVPISVDQKLGDLSERQFALMAADCPNADAKKYVERIAQPLLDAAGPLPFPFHFRVADTEQVNAFALPGGYVTVNFGLLEAAQSGDEVAGVLGHEIQHALLRHGTRRMLRQMGSSALLFAVFGGTDLSGLSQLAARFASLSYDRGEESEADARGVALLMRAHIDPRGLATFFRRLNEDAPSPPEFLSTHPDPGDRAALVARAAQGGDFIRLPSPAGLVCGSKP